MTSSNGRGRRGTALAVAALVIVLAGCGSPAKTVEVKKAVSPRKALLASVRTTAAAKSARISMSISASGFDGDLTADGVTDFVSHDGLITLRFTGPAAQFLSGGIEVRTVDGMSYAKMPATLGPMLGGGKWLKVPDSSASNGVFPGFDQSDPSKVLAYLETVSDGVKKVGSGLIRGVETTHYEASLDLAKAVDRASVPASLRDELGKLLQKDASSLAMPADVWVDNDGLARRIQMKLDLGKVAGAGDASTTMSMDFYDFGVPVHVEAPPADQVTELPIGPTGVTGTAP